MALGVLYPHLFTLGHFFVSHLFFGHFLFLGLFSGRCFFDSATAGGHCQRDNHSYRK
jgi:hypothetical protein